ncbi:hypothetical protein [Amycolatopsis sp. FDAARGOS 1241]|uniref:hypothetical protein n=1 Tax=Amycolatopsis sp. FDAARGOS 1241 TaxID=2778070 RepID=UPI00195262FF|nr:hypothetical protein [Amycolatopsis sp. FDAARGOS 1241]QRP47380.1 hypothetical protein I6J71_05235 [Amycolatopsis sp. FDAARGOS 1241]
MAEETFTREQLVTLLVSSALGVLFGAGWWFAGATTIPDATAVLRGLDVAVVLAFTAWVVLIGRRLPELPVGAGGGRSPFSRRYGITVVAMVAAIVAGARVLESVLHKPAAVPAWVLLCVGLHFLPFVGIFGSRRFLPLALGLTAIAVLAVVLGAAGQSWAWLALPSFGGALTLWAAAAAGLLSAARPATVR